MRPLLWDTCAAIWISDQAELARTTLDLLASAHRESAPSYISPITAWEVGLLAARGRVQLQIAPDRWLAKLLDIPGVKLAPMPPELLIASSFLPGTPPRDPADRIVAATARDLGATLITRDRVLLAYGKQGHVSVVEC
ncbi:MAG TPA: type II toxin-antitoxin system VapC family toxin [Nitrobacter sp.]|jgi:PIN domain nuclease of toxin-antitoxin system|nr:type II toxin-antitoxin system VapC family toxin [Nitrobacter sp.]